MRDIDQIRRAHANAKPKPSNPAWCKTHRDLGIVLDEIEELQKKLDLIEPFCSRDPEQIYADYALTETTKDSDDLRQPSPLKTVDSFTSDSVSGKDSEQCLLCGEKGHFILDCPHHKSNWGKSLPEKGSE